VARLTVRSKHLGLLQLTSGGVARLRLDVSRVELPVIPGGQGGDKPPMGNPGVVGVIREGRGGEVDSEK
ncbi:hypothetical protein CEP82_011560, partial [Mobiluncus mulieris]